MHLPKIDRQTNATAELVSDGHARGNLSLGATSFDFLTAAKLGALLGSGAQGTAGNGKQDPRVVDAFARTIAARTRRLSGAFDLRPINAAVAGVIAGGDTPAGASLPALIARAEALADKEFTLVLEGERLSRADQLVAEDMDDPALEKEFIDGIVAASLVRAVHEGLGLEAARRVVVGAGEEWLSSLAAASMEPRPLAEVKALAASRLARGRAPLVNFVARLRTEGVKARTDAARVLTLSGALGAWMRAEPAGIRRAALALAWEENGGTSSPDAATLAKLDGCLLAGKVPAFASNEALEGQEEEEDEQDEGRPGEDEGMSQGNEPDDAPGLTSIVPTFSCVPITFEDY